MDEAMGRRLADMIRSTTGLRPSRVWHPYFGWAADVDGEIVLLHPDDWPEGHEHALPEDYERPRLSERKAVRRG